MRTPWRRSDSSASSNVVGRLAVCEEVAQLALVVRADRLVQRDGRLRGAQRLVDVLHRQSRWPLGQLFLGRLAAERDRLLFVHDLERTEDVVLHTSFWRIAVLKARAREKPPSTDCTQIRPILYRRRPPSFS